MNAQKYSGDIMGNNHGRLFGYISETCDTAEIICISDDYAYSSDSSDTLKTYMLWSGLSRFKTLSAHYTR